MIENIGTYNLAYCNSELVDAHLNSLHRKMSDIKNLGTYSNCLSFILANCVPGHAILMKKDLLNLALPFPNYIIHDHWLAYVASLHGGVKYIDQVLVKHRNHVNSAIGALRIKSRNRKNFYTKIKERKENLKSVRKKIELFYNTCSITNKPEKEILFDLMMSYKNFSLKNNIKRVQLFLKHRKQLLAIKKRSALRKWLFCYKMFLKIK